MKVAYLVNRYPKASHSFIRREILGLEGRGVEVVRISVRPHGADLVDEADREEAKKTHVLLGRGVVSLLGFVAWGLATRPLRLARGLVLAWRQGRRSDRGGSVHMAYLAEALGLVRLAEREGFQHVHAHFGTNPPAVCALARELSSLGFSFTVHGPEEFDRPQRLKLGEKISGAEFVVAISEFGRSQLYRWSAHGQWPKIHVVHCGLDERFLEQAPTPVPDVPRFVCVGRLCEQKGQLLLVQATAALRARGHRIELVLAGDGEMRGEIEALLRREGLEEQVRITGWATGDEVRAELLAARAMVLPSFAEGLPVVLMEALALHRPVISTYVAGIPELVVPGECGWLVPAGDVDALVQAMETVLETPVERLAAMGAAGAARVRRQHDVRVEAEKLHQLLRRCA